MTKTIDQIAEMLRNREVSRRRFLGHGAAAVAGAGLAPSLLAQSGRAFAADKPVTFVSWGGAYQDAQKTCYCDPFTAKTGTSVVQDGPMNESKYRTMVEAGESVWDVADVTHEFLYNGIKNNLFEKLDPAKLH